MSPEEKQFEVMVAMGLCPRCSNKLVTLIDYNNFGRFGHKSTESLYCNECKWLGGIRIMNKNDKRDINLPDLKFNRNLGAYFDNKITDRLINSTILHYRKRRENEWAKRKLDAESSLG